jgi:hypothetical protein
MLPALIVGGDPFDAERERVLGKHARNRRGNASPACPGQHEVADLDDAALGVQVMEHSGAEHLARARVERGERQQSPCFGEGRQLGEVGDELVAVERGEVAGIAELRVAERRHKPVDVLELGKSKPDLAGANSLRGDR